MVWQATFASCTILPTLWKQLLKNACFKAKTSLSKTIDKFNDGTGKWGIPYETKQGNKRRYFANYADCKGKGPATDTSAMLPLSTDTQSIPLKTG